MEASTLTSGVGGVLLPLQAPGENPLPLLASDGSWNSLIFANITSSLSSSACGLLPGVSVPQLSLSFLGFGVHLKSRVTSS